MSVPKIDPAQTASALAFSPQMPLDLSRMSFLGDIPAVRPGMELVDEGHYRLSFYAPEARSVAVQIIFDRHPMERDETGHWTVVLPMGSGGWQTIGFWVDGVNVINPMVNVGFGSSAPCNYVDLPQQEDFYHLKQVPHGAVTRVYYPSTVTGRTESCLVYTPAGYLTGEECYPVLYLQHGHGENETCWVHQGRVNFIADNLIAQGKAAPCVIVMNNGMTQVPDPRGGRRIDPMAFQEVLVKDCIPFIEKTFRVIPDKEHRAMAGLSMGSAQTSVLTMERPDLFAWAGIFSGFVQMPGLLAEYSAHMEALKEPDTFRRQYRLFFRAIGSEDVFLDFFRSDSKLLADAGLSPEA